MKKTLLSFFLLPALGVSAYNVSTEPSAKSALIEEFTGIHCGNCPDGHKKASIALHANPDDVFSVAIHAGYFASPLPTEPNFITAVGTEIHNHYGVNSYPSGDVSRRDFGSGVIQGRGTWYECCRTHTSETSPVNIWSASAYDAATGKLTVDVEAYFTEPVAEPRISVMMLQNNILGPQSGGQLGVEYPHRHMLRAMINEGALGEDMAKKNAGDYWQKQYVYDVPAAIDEVAVVPADLEVLVFVSDGQTEEVYKCSQTHPSGTANERFMVYTSAPLIPIGNTYALDYIEMYLDNYSGEEITTADFMVTVSGETKQLTWTGVAPAHEYTLIKIPLDGWWQKFYTEDTNNYSVKLISCNGKESDAENASVRGMFKDLPSWPTSLKFKIKTDIDAADNEYNIIGTDGSIIHSFGPYPNGEITEVTEPITLEEGKVYGFEVKDKWGDGIAHPRGSVKIYNANDALVAQLMEISDFGTRSFFKTDDASGIASVSAGKETVNTEYYDLYGRCVSDFGASGLYLRRITFSDGSVETSKIAK